MIEKAKDYYRLHVRPKAQAVRRKGKDRLARLLLRGLQRLDHTFQANVKTQLFSGSQLPVREAIETSRVSDPSVVPAGPTLVLSEGGVIVGAALLEWVLKC